MNKEAKRLDYFIAALSDTHIAEREFHEDGSRNPITDFFFDRELVNLLKQLNIKAQGAEQKYLVLVGDIVDPGMVGIRTRNGQYKYENPPTEGVAVYKMRRIINFHPEIFDQLHELIVAGWTIVWPTGNHDVFVSWPRVQKRIRDRIAPNNPEKIIFCDKDEYEICGLLFRHGYEIEPHNTVEVPENRFMNAYQIAGTWLWLPENMVTDFAKKNTGIMLKPCKILREPLGNLLTLLWTNNLKQAADPEIDGPHRWIGRMNTYGPVWRYILLNPKKYWFVAGRFLQHYIAGLIFLLISPINIQRKTSLKQLLVLLAQAPFKFIRFVLTPTLYTLFDLSNKQNKLATDWMRQRKRAGKPLRGVVVGHTNVPGRWTTSEGSIFNLGTWIYMYKLPPKPKGVRGKIKWFFGRIPPIPNPKLTFFMAEIDKTNEMSADIFVYDPKTSTFKEMI